MEWTRQKIAKIFEIPLLELISQANFVHNQFHKSGELQLCHLVSIKTGGCPEDCKYCAQSSHYQTAVQATPMMKFEEVLERAKEAKSQGVSRVCLGAAWREVKDNKQFDEALKMVRAITELDLEVCVTFGMLKKEQAQRLKDAGLYAYNHNLDTSESYYKTIISTRTYADRLKTLDVVQETGLSVCCGGIVGLGETIEDRIDLLTALAARQPESVPINILTPVAGTPKEDGHPLSFWEIVRMVAAARIVIPKAMVRLSCNRVGLSMIEQTLCFIAGANSLFIGEKLFTVPNPCTSQDEEMFRILGITKRRAYAGKA